MKTIQLDQLSMKERHAYMIGSIGPRPIAWVSSCDKAGNINLSPFSFFNCFSSTPPILVFSPSRRGRDNTQKDTLNNVLQHPEVVINVVTIDLAEVMNITSGEYDSLVNEFEEAGLTQVPSQLVTPPRVGESMIQFECKVNEVISLGDHAGAGNLVICQVLLAHFNQACLDDSGKIDPVRLGLIGRLGGSSYCKVTEESVFSLKKLF